MSFQSPLNRRPWGGAFSIAQVSSSRKDEFASANPTPPGKPLSAIISLGFPVRRTRGYIVFLPSALRQDQHALERPKFRPLYRPIFRAD